MDDRKIDFALAVGANLAFVLLIIWLIITLG